MAKIPFTKLGLIKNDKKEFLKWGDQTIEVKQYLPFGDKLKVIQNIVNKSIDDKDFANPCRLELYEQLEIFFAYTNVNFTDKQKEDEYKLYDLLVGSGLMDQVIKLIPSDEINFIYRCAYALVDEIYEYNNSAKGIMESITKDYSNLELDAEKLQSAIGDPENLAFLRSVMEKLG